MTFNTTLVRRKGSYNGWMTLKLSRGVGVRYLHMRAMFQVSRVVKCRENPNREESILGRLIFFSNFPPCFPGLRNVSQPATSNSTSLPVNDWRQQLRVY